MTTTKHRPLGPLFMLAALAGCGGSGGGVTETANSAQTPVIVAPAPAANPPATAPSVTAVSNVSFLKVPPASTTEGFVTYAFSAASDETTECALDNEAFLPCTSPHVVMPLPQMDKRLDVGTHVFLVRAVSASGSKGTAAAHQFDIVSNAQAGTSLSPTNVMPVAAGADGWRGIFRINCDFSHSSYNDPVVYPGLADRAHMHMFYGNMGVDHNTTLESLFTTGDTSCQGGSLNRSAYWVPALLAPAQDNSGDWQVVKAKVGNDDQAHEVFYYSAAVSDVSQVRAVPFGLRMIAGTGSTKPGNSQPTSVARWHCLSWGSSDRANPRWSDTIPECAMPDQVRFDLFFPSCWNGRDLDSADHKSHMAYPVADGGPDNTVCPASHPVAVARVSYHYAFPVLPGNADRTTGTSKGWRLASDDFTVSVSQPGGLSLHGDWFNGWHPEVMEMLVANCLRGARDCHDGNLANGWRLGATKAGPQNIVPIVNGGLGSHGGN